MVRLFFYIAVPTLIWLGYMASPVAQCQEAAAVLDEARAAFYGAGPSWGVIEIGECVFADRARRQAMIGKVDAYRASVLMYRATVDRPKS